VRQRRRAYPALLAALAVLAMCTALPARGATPPGDDPIPLARRGQITDKVGALGSRAPQVQTAVNRLYDRQRLQLFPVYVSGFSGRSPQDWANAAAVQNGLGRKDVLLAVATHDRQYAVSADQESGLTQEQLNEVGDQAIEPALRENDWAGAAVGAADGYDAVLSGRPVTAPAITPGAADPVGAATRHSGTGVVWIPVVVVGAAALLTLWAYRRRSAARRPVSTSAGRGASEWQGRPKLPVPVTPLPELDTQARELLVATDDAVRTSQEDLGFAAAQFGDDAAQPFGEAVQYAKGELTAAFRLRQKLDDAYPEDDETRRQMLDEILSRCTQANRRLDAESEAFDRLRAMEANAPQVLARAEAAAEALPARVAAAKAALGPLAERYADSALEPVAGYPAEARDRLDFARISLQRARTAVGSDHGKAAVFVRAAEGALGQAATLADSVTRREQELHAAEAKLREALAETEADLAEARGVLEAAGGPSGTAELRGRVARAETVMTAVRDEVTAGRPDPIAALRRVEEADAALDAALAGARERESGEARARALLGQALLAARSEVAAARDVVTTHRGAIGSQARTRLTEAERRLQQAEAVAATDSAAAVEHAREADRLAREAQTYAQRDVTGYGGRSGRGGMGGAVLGGILLGDLLGGGRRGGYGFGGFGGGLGGGGLGGGPGSFGGGQTRGRMGGGGRF
jgi:uncharacterized membrane protein YgcG